MLDHRGESGELSLSVSRKKTNKEIARSLPGYSNREKAMLERESLTDSKVLPSFPRKLYYEQGRRSLRSFTIFVITAIGPIWNCVCKSSGAATAASCRDRCTSFVATITITKTNQKKRKSFTRQLLTLIICARRFAGRPLDGERVASV